MTDRKRCDRCNNVIDNLAICIDDETFCQTCGNNILED